MYCIGRGGRRTMTPNAFSEINLNFDGGGGADSVLLFSELFSQPKLDIFMGV